jgi:hypothetical protein
MVEQFLPPINTDGHRWEEWGFGRIAEVVVPAAIPQPPFHGSHGSLSMSILCIGGPFPERIAVRTPFPPIYSSSFAALYRCSRCDGSGVRNSMSSTVKHA